MAYAAVDYAFLQSEEALAALALAKRGYTMANRALVRHLET
jgi:hypothetical protein